MTAPVTARAPSRPSTAQPLLILAMDHRDSLERDLYRLSEPPTPVRAARIVADKLLVYQGLLEAMTQLPAGAMPGVLVDEKYGNAVARAAASDPVTLAMPIEASGHDWFVAEYGNQWREHLNDFSPQYAKVLIRDNPGLPAAERAAQASDVAAVCDGLTSQGRPLILELLVPATDSDLAAVNGDKAAYDRDRRPGLTVSVIRYLQDAGIDPAIWKVEGLETTDAAEQVVAAARRDGRNADCIVLGRNADQRTLDRWLGIAAPVDGFVGFAIGRSIWWEPLRAHLNSGASQASVRTGVAANYLEHVRRYLAAAAGS